MANNAVNNMVKLRRPVIFEGLPKIGPCSPSDLDAPPILFCIEVGDLKRYLIGDFKEEGKWFRKNDGQKILLERHVLAFRAIGYMAVAFLAWHPADADIIDAASSVVVLQYAGSDWKKPPSKETLLVKYCRFFDADIPQDTSDIPDWERKGYQAGWEDV